MSFAQFRDRVESSEIIPEGGVRTHPSWAEDLPFLARSVFELEPEDNRATAYLQVALDLEPIRKAFFPSLNHLDDDEIAKLQNVRQEQLRAVSDFADSRAGKGLVSSVLSPTERRKAMSILAPFEPAIGKLLNHSSAQECYLHTDYLPSSINSIAFQGRAMLDLLALRCQLDIHDEGCLESLSVALQLARDLRAIGSDVDLLVSSSLEARIFREMVHPILCLQGKNKLLLAELVSILKQHDEESRGLDLCIESAKRTTLDFAHLFHLIEFSQYATPERIEDLFLEKNAAFSTVLLRELLDTAFLRVNVEEVETRIVKLAAQNAQAKLALDAMQKAIEQDSVLDEAGARLFLGFLLSNIQGKADIFEIDKNVLRKRIIETEQAVALSYPQSTAQLRKLEQQWTLDDSWKKTKVLWCIKPRERLATLRVRSQLYRNAYLCLSAHILWQLEHMSETVHSLNQTVGNDLVASQFVDPYSGKTLGLRSSRNKIAVYSAGPDLKNQSGRPNIFFPWSQGAYDLQAGDIVFEVPRPDPD